MTVEEGDHAVVQKIGRRDRRLAIIELGASNLGVGVDKGLLVDTPDPLQIANIERVLGAAVARMFALKFAMGLLLGLGLFQRDELGLGQYQAFLGALGLQGFEPLVHGLEVMTLPHATHAGRRDREPALPQLVGDADLAESRLLNGNRNDGVFDLLCDAVFQYWLLAADLLQRQLGAFVIKLLEAVEAVAAITHHLAGPAHIAKLLGKLQEPDLGADDLLFGGHGAEAG